MVAKASGNNHGAGNILDGSEETKFKTEDLPFPWISIELQRAYRITKIAFLSGDEPIMNLDVRVGTQWIGKYSDGNTRFSGNTRCGMFHGPTVVTQQWVELDCGYERGIKGGKISFQLTERTKANSPLEITSVEIFGWGQVCV